MNGQLFVEGSWRAGTATAEVLDKYTGKVMAEVHQASPSVVERTVTDLVEGQRRRVVPPYERFEILRRASDLVAERRDALVEIMIGEAGFTHRDADGEVSRAIQTLRLCGEEATRLVGEMVPIEGAPGVHQRMAFTTRHPVGVVCAITPFNSPLNTVAHKVGPAIAAGNAVVLKPASATPLTAAALVEILLDAGVPPSHIALVHGSGNSTGRALLDDERLGFYTFTGSTEVGRALQGAIGLRRSQLELGSLSSTIICADADLDVAVPRCVNASFRKAGQVCTSVQRLYVDRSIVSEVQDRLVAGTKALRVGDPHDPETDVGPLISLGEAERVEAWVAGAVDGGARRLFGGERNGPIVTPAVMADVEPTMDLMCREVFGPVVSVVAFDDVGTAVDHVNDTPYGLAAGIFTMDLRRALDVASRLRVGSVHVNQTSSSRVDLMPYGGVKDSGFGHEGPRYAVREMTEERLITIDHG